MRILIVGDPHVTPEELDDAELLMGYVTEIAEVQQVDQCIIMGDMYHTHNVVRSEVIQFWDKWLTKLHSIIKSTGGIVLLVGNHDYAGEGHPAHALLAHRYHHGVLVMDQPIGSGSFGFIPYMPDNEAFIKAAKSVGGDILFCHQSFQGAKYDNGMYVPDGVDPEAIPQKQIISGHIHTPHSFGKVIYVGSPRWRTLSDANVDRAVWILDTDDGSMEPYSTNEVCRMIKHVTDSEENPITIPEGDTSDWRIDIVGTTAWVEKRKIELAAPGRKIRGFKSDKVAPKVRESEGIQIAFKRYVEGYTPRFGTPKAELAKMVGERL